jgi:hypothetical protein
VRGKSWRETGLEQLGPLGDRHQITVVKEVTVPLIPALGSFSLRWTTLDLSGASVSSTVQTYTESGALLNTTVEDLP